MVPSASSTACSSTGVAHPYYHGRDLLKSRYQLNLNAQEAPWASNSYWYRPVRVDQIKSLSKAEYSDYGPSIVY